MSADRADRPTGRGDVETLLSAARVFAAVTAEAIAQVGDGVTLPQLRVLVLASGSRPVSATTVAEALDVHPSSASRICERLVQAGLLDRREDARDRRLLDLQTTAAGQVVLDAVDDHRRSVFARILRHTVESDRDLLTEALARFVDAATEYDERRTFMP